MYRIVLLLLLGVAMLINLDRPLEAGIRPDDGKEWMNLFNGKDLTGWKKHPDDKAKWVVTNGVIVGSGERGLLFTEKGDFTNCHFKIEAQVSDQGSGGLFLRTQYGKAFPPGYRFVINSTNGGEAKTGSLDPAFNTGLGAADKATITVREALHKPNEWFTQEVITYGNHIIVKVNGSETVNYRDEKSTFAKGHAAIQQRGGGSAILVRKAMYKFVK